MARRVAEAITSDADALRLMAERLRTQATRPNIYGYKPHTKQVKFHSSTAKKKLYIGGNRSGKTVGGICEDIMWATGRHPYRTDLPDGPIRGRVVTVDYANGLEKIILPEIQRWCPSTDLRGGTWSTAYDKQLRTLHFENGSFIEFMSYDQDLDKFAGTSRHFIHFDEEPPEDIYTECLARLVDTGGSFWITMTPVEGMTWVYDTLYEPGVGGDDSIEVVTISMTENPYLGALEVEAFLGALSVDERKAREHGEFVQLGGLVYKEFSKDLHVIEPMVPPKDWLWACSLDHGLNNPTAWLWHAVGPDGQVVTFREHYVTGHTVDWHAAEVNKINAELGRPPDYYVGDPSIRNQDPITGTSIHEEYLRYGIPIVLGNNDVVAGINRVARYLRPRSDSRPNWVITENCVNLIRELTRYRWATYANKKLVNKNNAQEKAHKKDDHACDSARYFFMSRPDLVAGHYDKAAADNSYQNAMEAPTPVEDERITDPLAKAYGGTQWTTEYATKWGEIDEMLGGEW